MLMAFVMNALSPFFAVYSTQSAQAAEQNALSAIFGEKTLICTPEGFKWVSWAELQDREHAPDPDKQFKCPLCYVAVYGTKDVLETASFALLPIPTGTACVDELVQLATLKQRLLLLGRFSRGPPSIT